MSPGERRPTGTKHYKPPRKPGAKRRTPAPAGRPDTTQAGRASGRGRTPRFARCHHRARSCQAVSWTPRPMRDRFWTERHCRRTPLL